MNPPLSTLNPARALAVLIVVSSLPWAGLRAFAHAVGQASVPDTVAAVMDRFERTLAPAELASLTPATVLPLLNTEERAILGTGLISFTLDAPARLSVAFPEHQTGPVFWLREQGFAPTDDLLRISNLTYRLWEKPEPYPAGRVGLGVTSFAPFVPPYFVLGRPVTPAAAAPGFADIYPARLRAVPAAPATSVYVEVNFPLPTLPPRYASATLLQTRWDSRSENHLTSRRRLTPHPASATPDQVLLTWSGDPRTTQTIQFRTRADAAAATIRYLPREEWLRLDRRPAFLTQPAVSTVVDTPDIANDRRTLRHRAVLTGLRPGTAYVYSILLADGIETPPASFTTAPAGPADFSFVYLGDVQNGFDQWSVLLERSLADRPAAAFHLLAGDLVNRGRERDDWDAFFAVASRGYSRLSLVPVIGNHECQGEDRHPSLYLKFFGLPANGPAGIEPGRAYHFTYGDALFVILDSNLDPAGQTAWLDATLAASDATWKFVSFHHPIYGSDPARAVATVRAAWMQVLDDRSVDLVLQGHDHAYLRTQSMRAGRPVTAPFARGTTYVVAVAGSKMYPQGEFDYTAKGFVQVPTWQAIDLSVSGRTLHYRAYDAHGVLRDELLLKK